MTWNKYEENINEQLIRQIADKMATDGYAAVDINTSLLTMHGREDVTNVTTLYLTLRNSQAA